MHKGISLWFCDFCNQAQTIVTMKDTDFSWICSDRWGTDRSVVLNGPVESMDLWQGEKDECRIWGVYICIPFVYRLYTVCIPFKYTPFLRRPKADSLFPPCKTWFGCRRNGILFASGGRFNSNLHVQAGFLRLSARRWLD